MTEGRLRVLLQKILTLKDRKPLKHLLNALTLKKNYLTAFSNKACIFVQRKSVKKMFWYRHRFWAVSRLSSCSAASGGDVSAQTFQKLLSLSVNKSMLELHCYHCPPCLWTPTAKTSETEVKTYTELTKRPGITTMCTSNVLMEDNSTILHEFTSKCQILQIWVYFVIIKYVSWAHVTKLYLKIILNVVLSMDFYTETKTWNI